MKVVPSKAVLLKAVLLTVVLLTVVLSKDGPSKDDPSKDDPSTVSQLTDDLVRVGSLMVVQPRVGSLTESVRPTAGSLNDLAMVGS